MSLLVPQNGSRGSVRGSVLKADNATGNFTKVAQRVPGAIRPWPSGASMQTSNF